ncbi:hypothetical protein ACOSP7_031732 [Xanthoceras sorbifolium]
MENDLILGGRPISAGKSIILSDELLQIAHRYILFNSLEVQPYVELHLQELRSSDRRLSRNHNQLQKRHIDTFIAWFSDKSSKKAAKRALKQRQAIYASITRSRNRGIVITNEDSSSKSVNPNTQDTPNTQVTQESNCETKNKTRGVTRMVKLKFNQPVEVDFNLHGQTIDGSSITLASYIGILAREHIPITLESWKKVDEQKKDMIWSSLLVRFILFFNILKKIIFLVFNNLITFLNNYKIICSYFYFC